MDLLKPNTFRPILQPSNNTVEHVIETVHTTQAPEDLIEKILFPEYDPVMITQYNGFARVIRTTEELPFSPEEWVTELYVPLTYGPIRSVSLYTQRIAATAADLVDPATFDQLDPRHRIFYSVYIRDADLVGVEQGDGTLTPIGQIFYTELAKFVQPTFSNVPSNITALELPVIPHLMEKHADAAVTLKTGYQLEIAPLSTSLAFQVLAGFKGSLPVLCEDKELFYDTIGLDKLYFEKSQYVDSLIVKAGTYKQAMSARDENGWIIKFPDELKFGVWFCMLNVSLKRQSEDKCREHFVKRMQAICDIAKIKPFKLAMSSVTYRSLINAHDHVRKYFKFFVKPIFIGHFNDQLTPVIDYIRTMLSGYEMSGFLAINSWLHTTPFTRAHVDQYILAEAKEYKKQYEEAKQACAEYPIDVYRLLVPNDKLVDMTKLQRLRFCAITWRRQQGGTWKDFKAVEKCGQDSPDRLIGLMSQKLRVRTVDTVRPDLLATARDLGIPVNDNGAIDVEDPVHKLQGLERLMGLFS